MDLNRRAAYWISESSVLINYGGYHDLFVCPWWFIDYFEIHQADRTANLWTTAEDEGEVKSI